MLGIDLKQTDKLDISKPLQSFCVSSYGKDQAEKARPFLDNFSNMRLDVAALQGRGGYDNSRSLLRRYLSACCIIEQRIPIGEGRGYVPVRFAWMDSFRPKNKSVLSSIQLEKACIVFNLGALYSLIGRSADRSSAEGVKEAIKNFQTAAGVFSLLRDQLARFIVGTTTIDLSEAALSMCVSMLLAQAQSCFYEKAVKDQLNRSLLSKLACQTAQYYSTALNFAQQLAGQIEQSWQNHFKLQELCFLSAAHYQAVLAAKDGVLAKSEGYGSLIARLKVAQGVAHQAVQLSSQYGLPMDLTALTSGINRELAELERDNNAVYLEVVPPSSALPPLEMLASVKATPTSLAELCDPLEHAQQVFDRLVPADVRAKMEEYTAKCEHLVAGVQGEVTRRRDEVQQYLSSRGLPFAVDAEKVGLPDALWTKIQEVQVKGGMAALASTAKSLEDMAREAHQVVASMEKMIQEEAMEDSKCKQRFAGAWSRLPSDALTGNFMASIRTYKDKLQLAENANLTVKKKVEGIPQAHAAAMAKSRDEVQASIPSTAGATADSPEKQKVRSALSALDASLSATSQAVEELKKQVGAENISGELLKARQARGSMDPLIEGEVKKFDAQKGAVTRALSAVAAAQAGVGQAWDEYSKKASGAADQRTQYLKAMETSAQSLLEAYNESAEGVQFFNKLLEYLRTLHQQIDDFAFARSEERKDLLAVLSRQLAGMNVM